MKPYANHMINAGFDKGYVKITKLLYFMTRLGTAKMVNNTVEEILNRPPTTLNEFIYYNNDIWKN